LLLSRCTVCAGGESRRGGAGREVRREERRGGGGGDDLRVGVDVLLALAKGVEVFGAADEDHAEAMLLEVLHQLQAVPLVEAEDDHGRGGDVALREEAARLEACRSTRRRIPQLWASLRRAPEATASLRDARAALRGA
jgi:hypothetical protein